MKRTTLAAVSAAILASILSCGRVDTDRTGLVKLSDRVYAYVAAGPKANEGLGANSGFVVGSNGVLVVNARYTPALAAELLGAIRSVTRAPVRFVVDTDYHPAHAWGNSVFKEAGARIVSTAATRDSLVKYTPIYLDFYREHGRAAYEMIKDIVLVPPDTVFAGSMEIDLGGVAVSLKSYGAARTAGDAVVLVPRDRIVFSGGIITNGYHPNLGDPGLDLDGWRASLDSLAALRPRHIVAGQGKVCGVSEIDSMKTYLATIRSRVVEEIGNRTPLETLVRSVVVPGTEGWLQGNLLPFNVQAVYRREVPRLVRPDFSLDLPAGFVVTEGGGDTRSGRMRWATEGPDGYLEIEVEWRPTTIREVIAQDLREAVERYSSESAVRELEIEGSKRVDIGGGKTPAIFGRWGYRREAGRQGDGLWSWTMVARGGKLYSIRLVTDAGSDAARERKNIESLERTAGTLRTAR